MPARRIIVVVAVLAALTACSSTKQGAGTGSAVSSVPSSPVAPPASGGTASTSGQSSAAVPATTGASATTGAASASAQPAPSHPVRTATVHGVGSSAVYRIEVWVQTTESSCAAHAYGAPVIAYLTAHPCRGLSRLLATTTVNGKRVGFAQSSLAFLGTAPQDYDIAAKFRKLVTQDGTGNVSDLLREGRRLPSGPTAVPSPNAFSALGEDAGVVIVEAWYLDGPTPQNDPALVTMARDIFLSY